jgi:hypothetical protein
VAWHGGGGIQVVFNSKAYIAENAIEGNECGTAGGGAIFINRGCLPNIHRNVIRGNTAGEQPGGGIECLEYTGAIITENLFLNNSGETGGAIHARDSVYAVVKRNTFIDNVSEWAGDAICSYGQRAVFDISNNIFLEGAIGERNTIVLGEKAIALIENNIIANTSAAEPIEVLNRGNTLIRYNCFWNERGDTISMAGSMHNIFADPGFIDLPALDLHLRSDSPCIDAGNPEAPLDPDSTTSDIGRYHFDQATGIDNLPEDPGWRYPVIALNQNYPNPFNPSTVIPFILAGERQYRVEMTIFDVRGHAVRRLFNGFLPSGTHEVLWDGTDGQGCEVGSGIYFCSLTADSTEATIKLILQK